MLDLQTKKEFSHFLQTYNALRSFKSRVHDLLTKQTFIDAYPGLSHKDFKHLLSKMDKLVINHFETKLLPKTESALIGLGIIQVSNEGASQFI